ncbi:MAG: LysM peptidoglycan-binding domain-containing protein [Dehalococcoidia bacterium]|nr:LysM peptidoglycan-binding domain-containing protein [Dehalococcoidia bacterium]
MAEPTCHYCNRPAEQECHTCGRLYCRMHGEDVCLRCMAPESAAPSAAIYRGSVLALLAGTAIAIFLLVRPPESESAPDNVRTLPSPTTSISATATPTSPGAAPVETVTAEPTPETTPTASPTPEGEQTYTVQSGDTLEEIAEQFGTDVATLQSLNPGVTAENLQAGETLVVPAR